ncbi:MAG: metalloregulator ArsR/SmtB family transcription factor [bacterium]|nr:metalloregulator ArsR/SmtB family transcription factor [bacterium]
MSYVHLPHHHGNEGENELELIKQQLASVEKYQLAADVFKQLGDTTRIRIFWLLCHCEECVINISAMLEMSSPAVSHHLRPLRASGLIVSRRIGKEVHYKAADTEQSRLLHLAVEKIMEIHCPEHCHRSPCEDDCQETSHSPSQSRPTTSSPASTTSIGMGIGTETSESLEQEQRHIIHEVHSYLTQHMDQRITIESLAKQYLMNPTTLKQSFKEVYGTSIAAHIKQHRMEYAGKLLRESSCSIAEIAKSVGYENQSKFTAAFKGYFHLLPSEYRKLHSLS